MSLLALIISLAGVTCLFLQGGSCLLTQRRPFSIGFLDLILATVVAFVALSLYSGRMVLGTEFGTIMAQGTGPLWLLRVVLVSAAILPTLCWHRIRQLNDGDASILALCIALALGVGCGIAAGASIRTLNPDDLESLRVYQYDVWWPPLVVWLTVCFANSVLALLKIEPLLVCAASSAALIPPLANFAIRFEELSAPKSRLIWTALEPLGFAASVLLLLALFTNNEHDKKNRLLRGIVLSVTTMISLAIAALAPLPSGGRITLDLIPLTLLTLAVIVLAIAHNVPQKPEATTAGALPAPPLIATSPSPRVQNLRRALPIKRLTGIAHAIALPVIALGLIDLVSVGILSSTLEIFIMLCFWLVFAERLAEGALDTLPKLFMHDILQAPLVKRLKDSSRTLLSWAQRAVVASMRFFTEGTKWAIAIKAILIPILTLFAITLLSEILSRNQTIIQPFNWTGEANSKEDISKEISDGLINALGRMRKDLRTDLLLAQRKSSGEHPTETPLLQAGIDSNTVGVAIAKSDDLQISGVKIPITFFAAPAQNIARRLLGTRTINGSVKKSSDTYTVWANSSNGESWQESTESPTEAPEEDDSCPKTKEESKRDPVDKLIEKIAFDVASSDPSFITAGMTKDWLAFQYFRRGLTHWGNHEARRDGHELNYAIACFQAATRRDKRFSIAFYRLGIATQHDGQPGTAIAAFRKSTEANSEFIPGALTEAFTLYNFNAYYPPTASILAPLPPTGKAQQRAAFRIWTGLLDLPRSRMSISERQTSYYGLCLYYLDFPQGPEEEANYLSYFYCRRAAMLFYHLPEQDQQNPEQRVLQASMLNNLGVVLDGPQNRKRSAGTEGITEPWTCLNGPIDSEALKFAGGSTSFPVWGSRTSRAALEYYRESLSLAPGDPIVSCNAANSAAFTDSNLKQMEILRNEATARVALANELSNRGYRAAHSDEADNANASANKEEVARLYQRAMLEYQAAIKIDSTFLDALTGYSALFWQWKVDALAHRTSLSPSSELGFQAEKYAREAIRVARARNLLDEELTAKEILGEVILGQGRLEEARQQFDILIKYAQDKKPQWRGLSETHWDAAQTKLCKCFREKPEQRRRMFEEALQSLATIRSIEEEREWQPFSTEPDTLDPLLRQSMCPDAPDHPPSTPPSYALYKTIYGAGPTCKWAGVIGRVDKAAPKEIYILHVWGGGVDHRIRLEETKSIPVQLKVGSTHAYYFAQLENDNREPLSAVHSFDTYDKPKSSKCTRNLITLIFLANPAGKPVGSKYKLSRGT